MPSVDTMETERIRAELAWERYAWEDQERRRREASAWSLERSFFDLSRMRVNAEEQEG